MQPERGSKYRYQQGRRGLPDCYTKKSKTFWGPPLRMKRGRLIAVVLFVVFGTAAIVGLGPYASRLRIFPVKEVVFQGNRHLSERELKTMSGLDSGGDLLGLSARTVAERLLKSPWVRAVSVRKDFPDRVLIRLHEALPFAIVEMKGQAFLVDETGRLLERMKDDSVPFLPVIYADPIKNRDNFMEAISLAGAVRENRVFAERGRVEIVANGKRPDDMAMVVDGVIIKVGYGGYKQKLRRLIELEDEIRRRAIAVDYIDLRYANRVVVKPISEVIR